MGRRWESIETKMKWNPILNFWDFQCHPTSLLKPRATAFMPFPLIWFESTVALPRVSPYLYIRCRTWKLDYPILSFVFIEEMKNKRFSSETQKAFGNVFRLNIRYHLSWKRKPFFYNFLFCLFMVYSVTQRRSSSNRIGRSQLRYLASFCITYTPSNRPF